MTHRAAARMAPASVPSHDDWIERKRAQNRIAQRNYRRNVKRRIEELEQQVATQAKLLALESESTKLSQAGTSSFSIGEVVSNMGGDPRRPAHEGQKDASAPLPSPTSGLLSPQEDTSRPDTLYTVLSDCHEQGGSGQGKDHLYGNLDGHVAARGGDSARVETDSQARAETGERRQSAEISLNSAHAESPTQFVDLHLGMLDGMHLLRTPNEAFSFTGGRSQRQDSTADWCDFDRGSHSPRSTSDDAPSTVGDAAFEPTLEGRIEYLIGCAHKAGFQDLDSAMIAFYTATFDEGSGCSIAQHLSRKRCLPKLLEELRSHAGSWGSWEARAYQDEILRSAESLLLAEMGSTAPASGDRDGNWSVVSHQLRDEMPHLWSLLTTLLLRGNQQPRFEHQPRLVTAAASLLSMTNRRSLKEISQRIDQILTR